MTEVNEAQQPIAESAIQENTQAPEGAQEETIEQINWRKFRKKREEERKQLEEEKIKNKKQAEEISALKSAIEAVVNKPSPQAMLPSDYAAEPTEEDKIKKYVQDAIESVDRKREEQRAVQETQQLPQKLNQAFSDFNNVCSHENLDYLEYHYPEVAAGYKHMPDSFEKWSSVYKAIKRFIPNPDAGKDQKKAERNTLKPQSMNSAGMTITGDSAPVFMDDKRRADNWARMQKVMRGAK